MKPSPDDRSTLPRGPAPTRTSDDAVRRLAIGTELAGRYRILEAGL